MDRIYIYLTPKETDAVRENADQMIENALNQVSDDVHFNAKSKKVLWTVALVRSLWEFTQYLEVGSLKASTGY